VLRQQIGCHRKSGHCGKGEPQPSADSPTREFDTSLHARALFRMPIMVSARRF
jgi:hypothetical protein